MAKDKERLDLYRQIEKELKYSRFIHTMGVTYTASSLAMRYGCDMRQAETAGLLHDCAKYLTADHMEELCKKADLPLSGMEKGNGALLHSKAGSVLARTKYGVEDAAVLDAIRYHTTGRPGMSLLEKIVFIADYIEPGRNEAPHLDVLRKLAFEDIDQALVMILEDTLAYLEKSGKEIDPMTQKTCNYYKQDR